MSATHFQVYRHPGASQRHGVAIAALGDAAGWVADTWHLWRQRIRERDQLARLDDRMLSDIGLNRADAEFIASKPFWKE